MRSKEYREKMSRVMKGKKKTPEHIDKVRIALTGRKQSPEALRKNIESHKGLPSNRKGVKLSIETRNKISASKTGIKTAPRTREFKDKMRELKIMYPNRKFKDTVIELKVEKELQDRSIAYKKQFPLFKTAIVDFYLTDFNIVIQCDGCYYHNCPIHHPNSYIGRKDKDLIQDNILMSNGIEVYRFWEHEINNSVEECINKIKECNIAINEKIKKDREAEKHPEGDV